MSEQATITIADTSSLTVPGTTKVRVVDFVTISEGSSIVARMDATFDFAEIPQEFHVGVINNLLSSRVRYSVWSRPARQSVLAPVLGSRPTKLTPPSSPATAIARTNPPRKWWQLWRKP